MPKLKPVSPGELLLEEFLRPMGLSQYRLGKEIGVPAQRISEIVGGKRTITADADLRLCRFFGLSNGYWLRAQVTFDTEVAEEARAMSWRAFDRGTRQPRGNQLKGHSAASPCWRAHGQRPKP